MHPHHENLFVVRTVEDADAAALWNLRGVTPKEVVRQLFGRGLFEGADVASLRVHARHDVLDRAVLAGSLHRLEDDEHRPGILRVEDILLHGQPRGAALQQLRRLALVHLEA
jgi:hypothetical protein